MCAQRASSAIIRGEGTQIARETVTIFKACDVRGIAGEELNGAMAGRIGRSLGRMMRTRGESQICVGGDFRRSTPELLGALTAGLVASGVDVAELGRLPTPMISFFARHVGCANAAIVTASHNPGHYNGVKFLIGGRPALPDLIGELVEGLDDVPPTCRPGRLATHDVVPIYGPQIVEEATKRCSPGTRSVRVVLDTMAGAFTHIAPTILQSAGHHVTSICQEIDPDFAEREPNPAVAKNLRPLVDRVGQDPQADVGIAFDGDGDRVVFVDHTGRIVPSEQLAALLVLRCYQHPTVVYDLKCASVLRRTVEAEGGTAVMRPSGYGFIKTTMIERQADLGVEVSGHHFARALGGGDDGLFTALVVLNLLSNTETSLADLIEPIGWPAITPELRIPFRGDAAAAIEQIATGCGGEVSRLDGLRADYDGGWGLVRASITEAAITLRFEGRDRQHLIEIASRFLSAAADLRTEILEKINE